MTNERRAELLVVMEHCVLNGEFCDDCPNNHEDYGGCRKTPEEFFEMVKNTLAQRDALLADLKLVCTKNNPCLVCGHFRPEREDYEKCELKEWVCEWEWRGEKHG